MRSEISALGVKTLIITAAPNRKSFTHAIWNKILENNSDSEIINLYSEEYKLDFLQFENKREFPENQMVKKIQEKITDCDELVFVFPVWWSWVPAIMKNFFDSVFISGFAFEYGAEWKKELLTSKTAKVISTCDAPANIYGENSAWTWVNLKTYFDKSIFWFCVIKMTGFTLLWELRATSLEDRENFLENL